MTRVEVDAVDGVLISTELLAAAGFVEHEKLEVTSLTAGTRLSLPVRSFESVTSEVAVTGPAAHLLRPGEVISLSSYAWMREKQARKHQPKVVSVDEQNRPVQDTPRRSGR